MSAHTPGPWVDLPTDHSTFVIHPMPMGGTYCLATVPRNKRTEQEVAANARLIAAAPDLLAGCHALLGLLALLKDRDDVSPALRLHLIEGHRIADARAAVTKAEASA